MYVKWNKPTFFLEVRAAILLSMSDTCRHITINIHIIILIDHSWAGGGGTLLSALWTRAAVRVTTSSSSDSSESVAPPWRAVALRSSHFSLASSAWGWPAAMYTWRDTGPLRRAGTGTGAGTTETGRDRGRGRDHWDGPGPGLTDRPWRRFSHTIRYMEIQIFYKNMIVSSYVMTCLKNTQEIPVLVHRDPVLVHRDPVLVWHTAAGDIQSQSRHSIML